MCGICGYVDFRGPDAGRPGPAVETLHAMVATLRHRGPDDEGVFVEGPVGIGQTRLTIVDLSDAGHQPMISADGSISLVFNGEIYNHLALRAELEADGVTFKSHCDTEVILHGYARWGADVFTRLDGMFAIGIWDAKRRELHLARDRFGIKPLYMQRLPGGVVFGSEIKALLASGRVTRELNWQALHEFLYYGNALGRNTHFAGVERLLAGHRLVLDESGVRTRAFWSVESVAPVHDDLETATAAVRSQLEDAVGGHLIGDVPIGVFLSGGIDSSAIAALAARAYSGKLQTFSVGFDFDKGVNELPKARLVAKRFGTEHHELHLAGGDMADVIEHLVRCHDEPFGDAADIPLYLLCRELGGSIKVILQGDGGDEIFAGYRRYNVLAHERFWRTAAAVGRMPPLLSKGGVRYDRLMRFFHAIGQDDPALRYAWLMTQEPYSSPVTRLMTPEAREQIERRDPFARYREVYDRVAALDAVQRALYTDCQVLLPDTYLEKVDKSTMAHGIEVRVPMLDNRLTDYVLGLPSNMKVRNRQKKWILRRALRGIVPDDILDGPKTGFGVPYGFWLRSPLLGFLRGVLLDRSFTDWGLFDADALARTIEEHASGVKNHGFTLYKLLMLGLWQRAYLASPAPVAA